METSGTVAAILDSKGREVHAIDPDDTVFHAIERLAERNIGALLVMEGDHLLGLFTERDYSRKVALQGRNSKEMLVREAITSHLVTVGPATPVPECMRLMTEHRIRHLPVLDGPKVVGVVSIGDLVNWIIHAQRATIQQLHSYIAGGYPG